MFASPPTSRPPIAFGWPVTESGPHPGLPIRPVARRQLIMLLTLSLPDHTSAEHCHNLFVAHPQGTKPFDQRPV